MNYRHGQTIAKKTSVKLYLSSPVGFVVLPINLESDCVMYFLKGHFQAKYGSVFFICALVHKMLLERLFIA